MKVESITIKKETELHYQKLMEMIQPGDTLLFMIYGSPDPDAVASAMTLHEILDKKKGLTKSAFVATEPWNRQQNIEFASALRLTIQPLNKIDFKAYRLTVLMDAQPSFFSDEFSAVKPQIVFDHHPREGVWSAALEDIRPAYGALSSMMTEYVLYSRMKLPRKLHTALLYGIKTDTDNFDRSTIIEDISAYAYHTQYANFSLIRRIELNQTPDYYLKYFDYAYHHMKNFRGRRVGFLGNVENADICVQIADFYLHLIGTSYVVVAGIVGDKLIIVFRGDGYRQNCGAIAQKAFGTLGRGGGHRSAARMEIALDVLKKNLAGDISTSHMEKFLCQRLKSERRTVNTLKKIEERKPS